MATARRGSPAFSTKVRSGYVPRYETSVRLALLLILLSAFEARSSGLFDHDMPLEVTIAGPFGAVFADTEDRTSRDFMMSVDGAQFPIRIRLRGHSRLRVCDFMPLRLDFRGADTAQTPFEDQDRLKLVTHCRNYDRAEQNMLEEFIAYRIFNVLTDLSYRVRLLRINYVDTDGSLPDNSSPRYGFVLEPAAQFAARTGTVPVTLRGVPKNRHDVDLAALMYVYQYLVANTDWGLVKADYDDGCCHNVDLYERDSLVLTIPYDLDLSGLVNANYAFPDALLRIDKVTQRLYRGLCTDRTVLEQALDAVVSRQSEILTVVSETPGLDDDNRQKAQKFLKRFFDRAAKRDKLIKSFERRCLD